MDSLQNSNGWTDLMNAVMNARSKGSEEIIKILLDRRDNQNV